MYGSTPPPDLITVTYCQGLRPKTFVHPRGYCLKLLTKSRRKKKFPPKNSLEVSVLLGVTGVVCLRELFTVPYFSVRSSGSSACLPLRAAILVYKIPSLACGWVFNQGLAGRVPNYLRFSQNWACDRCESRNELKQQRRRRLRKRHLKREVPLHQT